MIFGNFPCIFPSSRQRSDGSLGASLVSSPATVLLTTDQGISVSISIPLPLSPQAPTATCDLSPPRARLDPPPPLPQCHCYNQAINIGGR